MKYSLAIFDMDGTILDTLDDLCSSMNYALIKNGMEPRSLDEVRSFVGNGAPKFVERAAKVGATDEERASVYEDFTKYYKVHCHDKTKAYDGITELLDRLRAGGVKTAVVSNKDDYGVTALCREYFDGKFDFSIGRRDGIAKKPAPDMVNAVLSAIGVERSQAVYIGDSDVDYQTAQNSDMDCIAVEWGFRGRKFLESIGAKVIVATPEEVGDMILK